MQQGVPGAFAQAIGHARLQPERRRSPGEVDRRTQRHQRDKYREQRRKRERNAQRRRPSAQQAGGFLRPGHDTQDRDQQQQAKALAQAGQGHQPQQYCRRAAMRACGFAPQAHGSFRPLAWRRNRAARTRLGTATV